MTYLVPNYFIEENPTALIGSDGVFVLAYSSRSSHESLIVHNTMHVMILLRKGQKKITHQQKSWTLAPGDILLLSQDNYMMSELVDRDGEYASILVYFDDRFVLDFLKKYSIEIHSAHSESLVFFKGDGLQDAIVETFDLYVGAPQKMRTEILKLALETMLLYLIGKDKNRLESFFKKVLEKSPHRVMHILEPNLDMIETVEDMCRVARVSRGRLRAEVLKDTDLTPKAWLDSQRLKKASLLLRSTDESIASVATTCGYSTASWFGAQFKKHYGISPAEYRKQFG